MKKMIKNLMLVAVAAMAFVGCQNDNDEMNVTVKKTVFEFTANIEETTRSYFGEKEGDTYPTLWEGNEMVSLVVLNSEEEIVATAHSTVEAEEGAAEAKITATFEGELVDVAKLVAYIGSWDFNRTLDLDEQFASEVGKVNHTLISENDWDGVSATVLKFSHAVAYGNMTITDSPVELSKLSKVIVALDGVEYSISIGDMLESLNIWFACVADEDFEIFKVSLVADNGVTYSKSVDMTEYAADERLKFIKGRVSKFSISGFEKEAADHVVEFTQMSGPVSEDFGSWAGVGMKYTFSNDAGDTMQITFSEADGNPLKAGTYTFSSKCEDDCFYGNGTWIKLADADYETYISSGEVVVALVDDVYTVTYIGTIAGETYETTFTGKVAVWEYFEGHWYRDTNYGIWAKTVSGNVFFFDMYCDSSVGQVIPEGVYTYGWERPYFQYSTVNGTSINDGTVTVAHLESGYKIDINVTDANSNNFEYSFSGIVALHDANNAFKNPPIVYKDITVEAEMATVQASYYEGYLNYYGDSFDIDITTAEFDGVAYNLSLALAIPIGESSNGLIPAKTYTLGAADYTLTSESTGDSVKFVNAELVVGHTATGYTLEFTGENVMKTKFILTYSGKIAKADEYTDFRNPGDATKLATPQNVQATVITSYDEPAIEITWEPVENAYEYLVTCEETEDINTINHEHGCITTFSSLDYDTTYNFTIVAYPESESTQYKESDPAYVSANTPKNINAVTDYNITLTKITAIDGNTIRFEGDNSQDKLKLEFNPGLASIEAGSYAVVSGISSSTAMEVSCNSQFNMAEQYNTSYDYYINPGDLVNVAKDGDEYTITVVTSAYISSLDATKSVKLTYTGKLEADGEGNVFTSAVAAFNGNWTNVTFSDAKGNTLLVPFGTGGVNYLNAGTWDSSNYYSSGYGLYNVYYNGDTYISSCKVVVAHVDGAYDITFTTSNGNYTFNGSIENLIVPSAEPEQPTTEITLTTWNEGEYNPGAYTCNYLVSGNECSMKVWTTTDHGANATSLGSTTNYTISVSAANVGNLYKFFVQNIKVGGVTKSIKDTYDTTNNTMSVVNNGDGTFNVTINLELSDGKYIFTYTGGVGLPQLTTPTGLEATSTANEVTVNWVAVANATSYDVTCGAELKNVTGTTATFDGLDAGTTYNISVVAKAEGYKDSVAETSTVTTTGEGGGEGGEGGGDTWDGVATTMTYVQGAGTNYDQAFFSCSGGFNGYIKFGVASWSDGIYDLATNTYCGYGASAWSMSYFTDGTAEISGNTLTIKATVNGVKITATGTK